MENFEKVLKSELGIFKNELGIFKNEFGIFKNEFGNLKNEFGNFKSEIRNELGNFEKHFVEFKEDMKKEMSDFKSEMREEMSDFKSEVKDEIRDRFFVFEQEYGKTINAIHDVVLQTKEITSKNSAEIAILKKRTTDLETKYSYHDEKIQNIEEKVNSELESKKVGNLNS